MIEFNCVSINDTKKAAEYFAKFAKPGVCFALFGDLGSGKTTFSQFLIKSIIPNVKYVPSPTFMIVQTYAGEKITVWHADCYRLIDKEEFFELGLAEAFESCVTIIEWPEIIREFLPDNVINITFSIEKNGRKIVSSYC